MKLTSLVISLTDRVVDALEHVGHVEVVDLTVRLDLVGIEETVSRTSMVGSVGVPSVAVVSVRADCGNHGWIEVCNVVDLEDIDTVVEQAVSVFQREKFSAGRNGVVM